MMQKMELEHKLNGRWLQVWREDGTDGITWDELQNIKNEVFGKEAWAFEIFPPESELINTRNVRHLWLAKDGKFLPNLKSILNKIGEKTG